MTHVHRIAGAVAVAALTLGLRWASAVPVAPDADDRGLLRVAFRARPERIEVCRDRTPEELAGVPAHMRQARVCDGVSATYRLEVELDERVVVAEVVHGGGLRRDRPIYVFREVPLPPGEVEIDVRFARREPAPPAPPGAVPDSLTLERRLHVAPRQVVLVTYDEERRTMEAK